MKMLYVHHKYENTFYLIAKELFDG